MARSFATHRIRGKRRLDRAQIEFIVPPLTVESGQVFFGILNRIEQRGDDDDDFRPEPRLPDEDPDFTNRHISGHRPLSGSPHVSATKGRWPKEAQTVDKIVLFCSVGTGKP